MKKTFIFFLFCITCIEAQVIHKNDKGGTLRIPVVFHIVHKTPYKLNITKEVLLDFLSKVNTLINNVDEKKIDSEYSKNIELYLLESLSNCDTKFEGATWTKTDTPEFTLDDSNYYSFLNSDDDEFSDTLRQAGAAYDRNQDKQITRDEIQKV